MRFCHSEGARRLKNLVPRPFTPLPWGLNTRTKTLWCLVSCTYDWPSGEEAVNIITTNANKPI